MCLSDISFPNPAYFNGSFSYYFFVEGNILADSIEDFSLTSSLKLHLFSTKLIHYVYILELIVEVATEQILESVCDMRDDMCRPSFNPTISMLL